MQYSKFTTDDGACLAYRTGGQGQDWLVIANGYGASFEAWDEILERIGDTHRWLIWDYRGLYHSTAPTDLSRLGIEDHARDVDALTTHLGIDQFVMAGWSVGCQVALETWRRIGHRVRALCLINGAHDLVLNRVFGRLPTAAWLPKATVIAGRVLGKGSPLVRKRLLRASRSRRFLPVAERVGLIRGRPPGFQRTVERFLQVDFHRLSLMVQLAGQHETEPWLGQIDVPTLITAGTRDSLTPPAVSKRAAACIPGARYLEIAGGTHYAVMEFPGFFAGHLIGFMAELDPP